ncbi:hypothetical protein [Herbiconiux sp. VKM Ac-2851]|uniref:hypothetical protein n=1 Tax=Herbiconiux sp. VKM Ac-2851 TaxID=2739025 RepID=UPI0015644132|nr:hypothetical protein [Herbiconiux sp. VKM Ac-2851]NQX34047.1 hypothetical protein [Herbiconiux sp. VKM Ac-2851]
MVIANADETLFEIGRETPVPARESSFSPGAIVTLDNWEAIRDSGISPRFVSDLNGSRRSREEFLEGARMLGLNTIRKPLHPQQLVIADALGAELEDGRPVNSTVGILVPRRSSKTTSIVCVMLGRCALREEYLVGFTLATTGAKARARFRADIVGPLERIWPNAETRPFAIRKAAGSEAIEWPSGSRFSVLTPSGESFRSDALDAVVIDESGEASPELGEDLLAGARATQDTRPDGQFIIAGTAPSYRAGNLLYDTLEEFKASAPRVGIVEYSAPEPVTIEDYADWPTMREITLKAHPGVGTLTTIDVMEERWRQYREKPQSYLKEYLSIPGMAGQANALFDYEAWMLHASPVAFPKPPANATLTISVHPDRLASVALAAWRDEKGKACFLVLKHAPGLDWLTDFASAAALKRSIPVVYDNRTGSEVLVVTERMSRLKPRPRLNPRSFRDVQTATSLLISEIETGNVRHWNQDPLNIAVKVAVKRSHRGSTLIGRALDTDDILAVECAALGLHAYDAQPRRQRLPSMTAA